MKERIIIVRHAESLEDIDKTVYSRMKDLDIRLTEKGVFQASEFGIYLVRLLSKSRKVMFYTSPGVRSQQTLELVLSFMSKDLDYSVEVEPLIVKQDWGSINAANRAQIELDRYRIGVLRYSFPGGENITNLVSRLNTFVMKISELQSLENCDVVVFSHGFELRLLLKIILNWNEEYFESLSNVQNCECRILTRESHRIYSLDSPLRKHGMTVTRTGKVHI